MKNTFKRIAAFAITLCMLLSVVPAVAFAEGAEPAQLDHKEYDFNLKAYTYSWETSGNAYTDIPLGGDGLGKSPTDAGANLAQGTNQGNAAQEAVAALYEAGTVDWKYHSVGNITSTAAAFSFGFGKTSVNYNLALTASNQAGAYFAMTIKSPGTGDYKLTLDYFTHTTGAKQGSVYVLPASVTDIVGTLDYYDSIGTFSCESNVASATKLGTGTTTFSNTVSMKAGKEYILVFTNDALSTSHTGNGTRATLYLDKVTLDKQEKTPVLDLDTITYDFDLSSYYIGGSYPTDTLEGRNLANTGGIITASKNRISELYSNNDIYWNYHGTSGSTFSTAPAGTVYRGIYMNGASHALNQWFAITVRSPGAGNYAMTVNLWDSYYGASAASVYLLPVGTADIPAALTAENKVGTFECDGPNSKFAADSATLDVTLGSDAEYLMVFTNDAKSLNNTSQRATLYIDSITLDKIVSMDEITYDFGLGNRGETYGNNVTFSGRDIGTSSAGRTAVADRYTAGTLNWKYVNGGNLSAEGTATKWNFVFGGTDVNYSLSIKSFDHSAGSYFVTTIKSPGYGDYTLTLDYNTHNTGASEARIYILPVNTADIVAAINAGTAVATFSCDDPAITDGKALGEKTATFDVSLGKDEEYLMVFTNNKPATTSIDPRATIYLSGIKLTNKAAGGSEEVSGDYIADGKSFATFEEAVAVAYDADDLAVKLNADVAMDELIVPANLSIDLNGKTLTVDALSGSVTDSSAGNTGLLAAERDTIVFSAKNADAPLWDAAAGGYRFFDYLLEVFDEAEAVEGKPSSQKFWFKFHFYTDDACAELDQDAYALVAGGNSGFKVATHMSWNGEALPSVYYGIDGDVDAFSRGWATDATASRWLYIRVDGLDEDLYGTLRVKPELEVNGVLISNTVVTYTNEAPETAE